MKMKYILVFITACLIPWTGVQAQNLVTGKILTAEDRQPLDRATIKMADVSIGAFSNTEGYFELKNVPEGTHEIEVSYLGYVTFSQTITVGHAKEVTLGEIIMREDVMGLEEVVLTGSMRPTSVGMSPVKIQVVQSEYMLQTTSPTNLMEGLNLINGVQEVVACGVCFTNNISINGLPGAYTAVLLDGAPIYGNLASVYGLNSIPTNIIDRIEVIKGPNSTLYGSEAMAGVLNIITKDPATQPALSVDVQATTHGEVFANLASSIQAGKWRGYVGANVAYMNSFFDDNGDQFGDILNTDRVSLFTKWTLDRKSKKPFSIAAKLYYEDRRNGLQGYLANRAYRELRGNDQIYGESIFTRRAEVFGSYTFDTKENIRLDYSLSHHDQDSFYGSDGYQAVQDIAFANLIWDKQWAHHRLLMGATARYNFYDDNTVATERLQQNAPDIQWVPGVFVQEEWLPSPKLTLLGGLRLDHYVGDRWIPSPRLNIKYKPGDWTSFRLNAGTGFKIVNLFTEDHAFLSGQREVIIQEELLPETSYNVAFNFNHLFLWGESQGMLDVDLYYTYFTNKILPDYDTPGQIIYANVEGNAITRGMSVSLNHQFTFPLNFVASFNMQQAFELTMDGDRPVRDPIEFAPDWTSTLTVNYEWEKAGLQFAYTMTGTGPMTLPEVFDLDASGLPLDEARPTRSTAFAQHQIQLTKRIPKASLQVYGGVSNLANFTPPISPLAGFNDPNAAPGFSPYFDTAYAFAPLQGRELYLGLRWNMARR